MAGVSPMQRSLEYLRKDGWHAEIVERRVPYRNITIDLFNFADILSIRDTECLLVQCTSRSNVSARVKKITESPLLSSVRKAGFLIHVHGWGQLKGEKWSARVVDLS